MAIGGVGGGGVGGKSTDAGSKWLKRERRDKGWMTSRSRSNQNIMQAGNKLGIFLFANVVKNLIANYLVGSNKLTMKAVCVGSGSEGLQNQQVCDAILSLVPAEKVVMKSFTVVYIGTATYDLPGPKHNQTKLLEAAGGAIVPLCVTEKGAEQRDYDYMKALITEQADIIVISGGNTLFAMDVWRRIRLDELLRVAKESNETVLCGGSAGFICWFTGGHSDSWDTETYKDYMLAEAAKADNDTNKDEASGAPKDESEKKNWRYLRVGCLGFLDGLACAHYDRIQSNGVLRAKDFDAMMLRHSGERGFGLDHWAAFVVNGENYTILSVEGKPGSVLEDGSFSEDREGKPGMWVMNVNDQNEVERSLVDFSGGKLSDLLKSDFTVKEDEGCESCRAENPSE